MHFTDKLGDLLLGYLNALSLAWTLRRRSRLYNFFYFIPFSWLLIQQFSLLVLFMVDHTNTLLPRMRH